MEYKSNITLAERVAFTNSVIETATVNNSYEPALYDFAFRINAVIFFSDTKVAGADNEALNAIAYSDMADELLYGDKQRKAVLTSLDKACKEKIHYQREEQMAIYSSVVNPDPVSRLVDLLQEIVDSVKDQFDPEAIVKSIIAEREKTADKPERGMRINAVKFEAPAPTEGDSVE